MVVGAGTAGANVAHQLVRRGRSVVLLERRGRGRGGAQWHNGVLDWQFEAAGLAPPAAPERVTANIVTHLVGPDGTAGVTVHRSPTVRADMHLLGERLRALAESSGAEVVHDVERLDVEVVGDRVAAVTLRRDGEADRRIEARLVVDASGRRGAVRRRSPLLRRWCPEVRGDELCSASDHVFRVADPDGARRFLDRHGARPGEGVTMVGLAGGYSTRAITVSSDLAEVSVLVGCLANGRYGTGPQMMAATRADEPWLGDAIEGGSGVIPLRRPYARLTAPGAALVGDAACQVFPAHGSGIGFGLIAGRVLADAVADADDPGDPAALWGYQAAFQREHGGLLAAHDAFRRMSTSLGTSGVRSMVRAGLLTEHMSTGGLDQRWPAPRPADLPGMVARLATVPGVAARMLPMLARGQVLVGAGARYPSSPDELALARWDARVNRLLGPLPR